MSRRKIDQAKLQYWAGMIHDCQHSGLKTKEWLANHGISKDTYYYWDMVKAERPRGLLKGSPVSPSIAAAIMNGKYVNAVPLYRLEKEFERYGLAITRQNMANWMIRLGESYISVMYDYFHELIYDYHVIQADETPVLVNKDGRKAGSKS